MERREYMKRIMFSSNNVLGSSGTSFMYGELTQIVAVFKARINKPRAMQDSKLDPVAKQASYMNNKRQEKQSKETINTVYDKVETMNVQSLVLNMLMQFEE
ncbi:hypothetical protein CHS0354_030855 [Potamilus streckersoni]|uniref:Uncharacterized protein n=1 Tax=Potamilus streckersoni TaxID=2493646 RepID=A0AAE0VZ96_9BIVA|nr:hypothetical protein CHS0354_030855 [Potamilus streckersoni]